MELTAEESEKPQPTHRRAISAFCACSADTLSSLVALSANSGYEKGRLTKPSRGGKPSRKIRTGHVCLIERILRRLNPTQIISFCVKQQRGKKCCTFLKLSYNRSSAGGEHVSNRCKSGQAALPRRTVLLQSQAGVLLLHDGQLLLLVRLELKKGEIRPSVTPCAMII